MISLVIQHQTTGAKYDRRNTRIWITVLTTILAVKDKTTVYLGADSQATSGDLYNELGYPKIFSQGPLVVGFSGSLRAPNVLMHSEKFIPKAKTPDEVAWQFAEHLRKVLKDFKTLHKDKEEEFVGGDTNFIIAFKFEGKPCLYHIGHNFSYDYTVNDILVSGNGRKLALAGASTALKLGTDAKTAVRLGLEAACDFDIYSDRPFKIVNLTEKNNIRKHTETKNVASKTKNTKKNDSGG